MRRKDREVNDFQVIKQIIRKCDTIRLGFQDGDYPYIIPLSFGYEIEEEQIYFYIHGAKVGRKVDLIKKNGVCSFEMDCSHKMDLLYQLKDVTMRYQCLMGKAKIELLDGDDMQHGIDMLMAKNDETKNYDYNKDAVAHTMVAKLTVTEYSGKVNAPTK